MIRLPDTLLPSRVESQLSHWQNEIDTLPSYSERVTAAKSQFSARNVKTNRTFQGVKTALKTMCSGARRCAYCEDSAADEVEHFRPKDIYPEAVFAWENYLYSCGNCNSPKGNKFEVFDVFGVLHNVQRAKGVPILSPVSGHPILIDPRHENPMDFMDLDLQDTFFFIARDDTPEIETRARYTIELLHLNDRDFLLQARREAFGSYRARLVEYNQEKLKQASESELENLRDALLGMGHPTVWREMQRQSLLIPKLATLFQESPEALAW